MTTSGVRAADLREVRTAERERTVDSVRAFMLAAVESLQRQYREHVQEARARFPSQRPPCHTCAINPATNGWQGMENTVLQFARALQECAPFYCHDDAPYDEKRGWLVDPASAQLCSAFGVLMGIDIDDPERVVRHAIADALGYPDSADSPVVRAALAKFIEVDRLRQVEGYEAAPGSALRAWGELTVKGGVA